MFLATLRKLCESSDFGSSDTKGILLIIDFLILGELLIEPT